MDASSAVAAEPGPSPPKLKVFISYSRDDLKFADQLDIGLKLCGFQPMLDRHGISGGEDWRRRLGSLIRDADTIVFVLSPASATSEICKWEVDEAARLNKRILPVLIRHLEGASPPPLLQERNYVFFYDEPSVPGSGFGAGLAQLVAALQTDLAWIREHTRLLARATEWETGGRPINRLLSGSDIVDAKDWAARRPKDAPAPTNLHLDFIKASEQQQTARSSAERQQLEIMARAQEERAKALAAAEEALARAADAQRKRAVLRNGALLVVSLLAAVALFTAWEWTRANAQRLLALEERAQQAARAEEQRALAEKQRAMANKTLDSAINVVVEFSKKFKFDAADYNTIRSVVENGAEQDDSTSTAILGVIYQNGLGVAKDYDKARVLAEKAAAKGNPGAMLNLGILHENGWGVTKSYDQARDWYAKASANGSATAMNNLGILYENGWGGEVDYNAARQSYEKAAAKGNAYAMANLGLLYENGRGVPKEFAKAREWYEKAVDNGDVSALTSLGSLYANADGTMRDYAKAREWYEKGVARGEAGAMNSLAVLYLNGQGVPKDFTKAREWSEKAAALGNEKSKLRLRRLQFLEAEANKRYAEALKLRTAFAGEVESDEAKRAGVAGKETAEALLGVAWDALLAHDFATALSVAERSHKLDPTNVAVETNRAHALMFLHREADARVVYRQYKGKQVYFDSDKLWETVVAEDFAEFRKGGLTHPMMTEIEKELAAGR